MGVDPLVYAGSRAGGRRSKEKKKESLSKFTEMEPMREAILTTVRMFVAEAFDLQTRTNCVDK